MLESMLRETVAMNVNAVDIEYCCEGNRANSELFVVISRCYYNRPLHLHLPISHENWTLIDPY